MAYLYWIHLSSHTNAKTEGYIGVTTNMSKRWREHVNKVNNKSQTNNYLTNSLSKYKTDVTYTILFSGPTEGCYQLEEYFRPYAEIGWNLRKGGERSSGMEGKKHSEETKAKMRISQKNKIIPSESKERMRAAGRKRKGSANPFYGKTHTKEVRKRISEANKNKISPNRKAILHVDTNTVYDSLTDASTAVGLTVGYLSSVCKNGTKTRKGYFKYKD